MEGWKDEEATTNEHGAVAGFSTNFSVLPPISMMSKAKMDHSRGGGSGAFRGQSKEQDDNNKDNSAWSSSSTNHVRAIAENHAVMKAKLFTIDKENADLDKTIAKLKEDLAIEEARVLMADERLLNVQDKLLKKRISLKMKEELYEDKLKELVSFRCSTDRAKKQGQVIEASFTDFQVERAICKDKVAAHDAVRGNAKAEIEESQILKEDIKKLQDLKTRLESGDIELEAIKSGEKLVELELRRTGIQKAFEHRDAKVESIYMEIDEKNEAVESLSRAVLIKEKGNQARVRKLMREVQEKEETESHLKQTAEYLDNQIDPAVAKGPANSLVMNRPPQGGLYFINGIRKN